MNEKRPRDRHPYSEKPNPWSGPPSSSSDHDFERAFDAIGRTFVRRSGIIEAERTNHSILSGQASIETIFVTIPLPQGKHINAFHGGKLNKFIPLIFYIIVLLVAKFQIAAILQLSNFATNQSLTTAISTRSAQTSFHDKSSNSMD